MCVAQVYRIEGGGWGVLHESSESTMPSIHTCPVSALFQLMLNRKELEIIELIWSHTYLFLMLLSSWYMYRFQNFSLKRLMNRQMDRTNHFTPLCTCMYEIAVLMFWLPNTKQNVSLCIPSRYSEMWFTDCSCTE